MPRTTSFPPTHRMTRSKRRSCSRALAKSRRTSAAVLPPIGGVGDLAHGPPFFDRANTRNANPPDVSPAPVPKARLSPRTASCTGGADGVRSTGNRRAIGARCRTCCDQRSRHERDQPTQTRNSTSSSLLRLGFAQSARRRVSGKARHAPRQSVLHPRCGLMRLRALPYRFAMGDDHECVSVGTLNSFAANQAPFRSCAGRVRPSARRPAGAPVHLRARAQSRPAAVARPKVERTMVHAIS